MPKHNTLRNQWLSADPLQVLGPADIEDGQVIEVVSVVTTRRRPQGVPLRAVEAFLAPFVQGQRVDETAWNTTQRVWRHAGRIAVPVAQGRVQSHDDDRGLLFIDPTSLRSSEQTAQGAQDIVPGLALGAMPALGGNAGSPEAPLLLHYSDVGWAAISAHTLALAVGQSLEDVDRWNAVFVRAVPLVTSPGF